MESTTNMTSSSSHSPKLVGASVGTTDGAEVSTIDSTGLREGETEGWFVGCSVSLAFLNAKKNKKGKKEKKGKNEGTNRCKLYGQLSKRHKGWIIQQKLGI